jgi:hypothetical protein
MGTRSSGDWVKVNDDRWIYHRWCTSWTKQISEFGIFQVSTWDDMMACASMLEAKVKVRNTTTLSKCPRRIVGAELSPARA